MKRIAKEGGIPERAPAAYAGAALFIARTDPACKIGWNTLAAIGEVESHHGSINGAHLDDRGVATPPIIGIPLDGDNTEKIPDTDHGRYDHDTTWDHALGPMQFIPSTCGLSVFLCIVSGMWTRSRGPFYLQPTQDVADYRAAAPPERLRRRPRRERGDRQMLSRAARIVKPSTTIDS